MKKIEVDKELLQKVVKTGTAFVLAGTLLMGNTPVLLENPGNSTVVRAAEEELVTLNVQMGVNLYMNDKGFIPKDVNGNETYPFICDGTTYVPIRAIAELFNASVNWDANNNIVSITTTGEGAKLEHTPRYKQELYNMNITANKGARLVVNGVECIPTDVNNNIKDIYVVNGTTYVPVRAISTALGLPITWSDITNSVFIGKHKTEGLTVENINDLDAIEEAKWKFFPLEPMTWGYYYGGYNNDEYAYNVVAKGNNRKEFAMYIALFNWEYISDETLLAMLPDLDSYDIRRMIFSLNAFVYGFYHNNDYYDWSYISIDTTRGELFDNLEKYCAEKSEAVVKDATSAAKTICDFYDPNCPDYAELKNDLPTLLFITSLMRNTLYYRDTEYNDRVREIDANNRSQFHYSSVEYYINKLVKMFEDRYFKALENQKQKQLNYN